MNVDTREPLRYTCPGCSARVRVLSDGTRTQCVACGYEPADDVPDSPREARSAMDGRGPRGW